MEIQHFYCIKILKINEKERSPALFVKAENENDLNKCIDKAEMSKDPFHISFISRLLPRGGLVFQNAVTKRHSQHLPG